jgi:dTDP-4-amino-4,6-dideoxygalactose transaminase
MMRVVDDQLFILGAPVQQLEEAVAQLSHTAHRPSAARSGTDALLLALRALNVGRGDEVVTTPFTFFATAGTVHNVGAKPVFCDIDPATFNMVPAAARAAATSRTKAVIPVDLFGQMAEIENIAAAMPGIPIIEDAAQTIGASRMIDGERRMAGEIATIGTFSFFPSKNLGGYGDGGMMVTQNADLAKRLKRLRVHGGMQMYHHDEVGYNSRLDSLQAAVLHAKLRHLSHWSAGRRANAAYYTSRLRRPGRGADAPDRPSQRIDFQPVHPPCGPARRPAGPPQGPAESVPPCTIRSHCISNPVLSTSATNRVHFLSPNGPPSRSCPCRSTRKLTSAQRDEVVTAVRAFYGR